MRENCYQIDYKKELVDLNKFANFYVILDYWLKLFEEGKKINTFFERRGYKKISIYGMASLGKHLMKQLENSDIEVIYTVDSGVVEYNKKFIDIREYSGDFPNVDVMIVTPIVEFEKIRDLYKSRAKCDVISLEEVILSV